MKRYENYLPPGADVKKIRRNLYTGFALAAAFSLSFFIRYKAEYDRLFATDEQGARYLRGSYMCPFSSLTHEMYISIYTGFIIFIICLTVFGVYNYLSFYRGSKSIYTMKRLKNPGELYIRCFLYPVYFLLLSLITAAVLTLVYYAAYMILTPDSCLLRR